MDLLPPELLDPIASYLTTRDLRSFAPVNQRTNIIARKRFVWDFRGLDETLKFLDLLMSVEERDDKTTLHPSSIRAIRFDPEARKQGPTLTWDVKKLSVRTLNIIMGLCPNLQAIHASNLNHTSVQATFMKAVAKLPTLRSLNLLPVSFEAKNLSLALPVIERLDFLGLCLALSSFGPPPILPKLRIKSLTLNLHYITDATFRSVATSFFSDDCTMVRIEASDIDNTASPASIAKSLALLPPTTVVHLSIDSMKPDLSREPLPLLPQTSLALFVTGPSSTHRGITSVGKTIVGPWKEVLWPIVQQALVKPGNSSMWTRKGGELDEEEWQKAAAIVARAGKKLWFF